MAVIGSNISATNSAFFLNAADNGLTRSIKRLASGNRLASPEDDAAGVAVSAKLDSSIRKLAAAVDGVQSLVSLAQTADGYLKGIQEQLTRMSELALRAYNGAFSSSDRANYQTEFAQLSTNITNQISNGKFNEVSLFGTGSVSTSVSADGAVTFTLSLADASTSVTGVSALDISTESGASAAIGSLTSALNNITTNRASMGAYISSLGFYAQNLGTERVNLTAANSRIKDVDFAEESTSLAKFTILTQAATAMLAQANVSQQNVLALLR